MTDHVTRSPIRPHHSDVADLADLDPQDAAAALRHQELGMFLRARREHLTPAEVGLAPIRRRRTPGLRREELAGLAGISTTWYTFLEQGRTVRPSRQVLGSIASALLLNETERVHLFSLADDQVPTAERTEYLSEQIARVPQMLDPNPAYITGSSYDLLAWNSAAERLFAGFVDSTDRTPNLVRWMFTEPAAKDLLMDWQSVAQALLARLRGVAGRHPNSLRIAGLVREIRGASTEADIWWPRYDIASSQAGTKQMRNPDGSETTYTYASFQVMEHSEQILTVYSPVRTENSATQSVVAAGPASLPRRAADEPELHPQTEPDSSADTAVGSSHLML